VSQSPEHRAELAVVEVHLLKAMHAISIAIDSLAAAHSEEIDHSDAAEDLTRTFLGLQQLVQAIHQEIKQ